MAESLNDEDGDVNEIESSVDCDYMGELGEEFFSCWVMMNFASTIYKRIVDWKGLKPSLVTNMSFIVTEKSQEFMICCLS